MNNSQSSDGDAAISVSGLTKYYGESKGIENVSFDVSKGEVFGFIGPNGAGKSTTIRTILGLLKASAGESFVLGKNTAQYGPEIRQKIGYLPSEVHYYDEMNAQELLEYSARFFPQADTKLIGELSEYFELDLKKQISDLSFGNKKKCAIIQCLLHKPEVLILDEPTSGLDPLMQNRFFELLEKQNEEGVSIFFSSHILSEVQRMCDRAAIIRDGEIVKIENIQTLLEKQLKKVRVVFEKESYMNCPANANNIKQKAASLSFDYTGNMNALSSWLAAQQLQDMVIQEPDLESIFMHYYER